MDSRITDDGKGELNISVMKYYIIVAGFWSAGADTKVNQYIPNKIKCPSVSRKEFLHICTLSSGRSSSLPTLMSGKTPTPLFLFLFHLIRMFFHLLLVCICPSHSLAPVILWPRSFFVNHQILLNGKCKEKNWKSTS